MTLMTMITLECLFLKKVDSIYTLKINTSISVRNPLIFVSMKVDSFSWNG